MAAIRSNQSDAVLGEYHLDGDLEPQHEQLRFLVPVLVRRSILTRRRVSISRQIMSA